MTPQDQQIHRRVGRNLTAILKERSVLPAHFARRIKISKGKLHYVLKGDYCSLEVAARASKALQVSLDSLTSPRRKASRARHHA